MPITRVRRHGTAQVSSSEGGQPAEFRAQFGNDTQYADALELAAEVRLPALRPGGSAGTAAHARCASVSSPPTQTAVTAGTIVAATKLALRTGLLAMDRLTQQKHGLSALALMRHLGISHRTAWRMQPKLMQVMWARDAGRRLSDVLQVDDASWGAERDDDTPGRGSPDKGPCSAAVACGHEGHSIALRLGRVAGLRKPEAVRFAKRPFDPAAIVLSDGLACSRGFAAAGSEHRPVVTGGG